MLKFESRRVGVYNDTATIETDVEHLDDVLLAFERFLKAAGYHFDGKHLELVEDYDAL